MLPALLREFRQVCWQESWQDFWQESWQVSRPALARS